MEIGSRIHVAPQSLDAQVAFKNGLAFAHNLYSILPYTHFRSFQDSFSTNIV